MAMNQEGGTTEDAEGKILDSVVMDRQILLCTCRDLF